jgi:hypothetical protein
MRHAHHIERERAMKVCVERFGNLDTESEPFGTRSPQSR